MNTVTISIKEFDELREYKVALQKIQKEEYVSFFFSNYDEWIFIHNKDELMNSMKNTIEDRDFQIRKLEEELEGLKENPIIKLNEKKGYFFGLFNRTKR